MLTQFQFQSLKPGLHKEDKETKPCQEDVKACSQACACDPYNLNGDQA